MTKSIVVLFQLYSCRPALPEFLRRELIFKPAAYGGLLTGTRVDVGQTIKKCLLCMPSSAELVNVINNNNNMKCRAGLY